MHRFYCQNLDLTQDIITITSCDEIHHIKNVLRLKPQTNIKILSDNNIAAIVTITEITTDAVITQKVEDISAELEETTHMILACAIPKKGKFELIIEKTTELGVAEIYPMITKRTETVLKGSRAQSKQQRFIKVAQNAAKQSNRNVIPQVHPLTSFENCIAHLKSNNIPILIPSLEEEATTLKEACAQLPQLNPIAILIGPEGDFTKDEYLAARAAGCIPITLGPTILKVETAAITTIAYLRQVTI